MEFENEVIAKFGGLGAFGAFGLKLLWSWFNKEKQDNSLYKNELAAHDETKKELAEERSLRKAAEVNVREIREKCDEEHDEDRKAREALKDEIFALRTQVRTLSE